MRARYYNTDIKRFINRDTVSGDLTNSQSLNKYSYVQGNPVNQTDPFGLSPMGGDIMSILPQLIHTGLAIGGFFWDGFDLINAVYYAAEGNTLMAMSCGVAAIPFLGSVASKGVSKIAFKVLKSADKASDLVKAAKLSKAAGYINDISKLVGYTGMATLGAIDTAYAYQDYKAAKANGEDATLELCSVILNGAFTVCSGIRAVSSAAKVTARLKADGVGDAVKAAAKQFMHNNKGCVSFGKGKGNSGIETINPNDIRFSQSSVNGSTELVESMKKRGWAGDPIDVVQMPDGGYTTIDNTRVVAARQVGIDVQANIHAYNELLPTGYIDRFTTKKGVPVTWGDAISLRIGKQKAAFRNNNPFGSFVMDYIK